MTIAAFFREFCLYVDDVTKFLTHTGDFFREKKETKKKEKTGEDWEKVTYGPEIVKSH